MDLRRLAYIILGATVLGSVLLILLWVIGLVFALFGGLIHLLLVLALLILPAGLITGVVLLIVSSRK
jgi:hypothetical protein